MTNLTSWRPGTSGNPSGRSKVDLAFRDACREHTTECLEQLMAIARDMSHPKCVDACKVVIGYAHGKPVDTGPDEHAKDEVAPQIIIARMDLSLPRPVLEAQAKALVAAQSVSGIDDETI